VGFCRQYCFNRPVPSYESGSRMRIALVDDTVYGYASGAPSATGGAERYTWLLVRALVARGWSAKVGVRAALRPGERVQIDGVEFVGIGQGHILIALYRFLAAERPDWCHWAGAGHLLGPAVAIAKLTGTRTVFSAQFDLDVHPRRALSRRHRLWPLYATGLFGCDRIFLQHGGQYEELPSLWKPKACVIPGVVSLPTAWKAHAERGRYVAWVGVLRRPKRPDLLVEIARRAPAVEFVVCGGPSGGHRSPPGYSEAVISQFSGIPNIRYLGHVPPAEAIAVIGGAALLLSTSDGEGFPSVFLEAWAAGTPVVSLKIDPDELISRRRLGVLAKGIEGAVCDITALVSDVGRRQDIACRCRDYVAQAHSAEAVVSVVERALKGKASSQLRPSEQLGRS
jgi:glycosyltransferase involved in cell wall biosynthesis